MTDQVMAVLAALALLTAGGTAASAGISTPNASSGRQGETRTHPPRRAVAAPGIDDPRRLSRRGLGGALRTISTDARQPRVRAAIVRAVAAFNHAGADLHLEFVRSGGDIQLTMIDEFAGEKAGETTVHCELPCRPKDARIIVERALDDPAFDQVVVHEIGHAVGLKHDSGSCSAMNDHVHDDDRCATNLARAPLQGRDVAALRAVWGASPILGMSARAINSARVEEARP